LRMRSRDLRAGRARIADVRKILVALVVVVTAVLVLASGAGGNRTARREGVPGQLSVVVPQGWQVLRGWLSYVVDPAPRLAMASFPARLSRHTCECGFPNVLDFPRRGAFIFVWEYLHFPRRSLTRVPHRPRRFSLAAGRGVRLTCGGPTGGFAFKDAGRVFQVEVYLGPEAGPALRAKAAAALDSLRVPGRA
jgi:hypothetical protein